MGDRKRVSIEGGKSVYTKNEKLRLEVIWLHYDVPVARYEGK